MTPTRPLQHLNAIKDDYPDAWTHIETFRQDRGKGLPDWPQWCFLPMAAWYAIACAEHQTNSLSLLFVGDVARLAALGAWRYTQSIYRLDPDLQAAIADTAPKGPIPCDVLFRMPEWCVYIETPGITWLNAPLHGFFASLEHDINNSKPELRLLLDTENGLTAQILHLGPWTITEAVDRAHSAAENQGKNSGITLNLKEHTQPLAAALYPLIPLLLYVCSNGVEYRAQTQRPGNPAPKRTKKGWRLFPAARPRVWNLGDKIGEQIRAASNGQGETTGKGKAPHIRRAHWHGYWTGPRDGEREFILKWLPPTPVGTED